MMEVRKATITPFLLVLIALIPLQNIYIGKIPSLGAGLNIVNILMLLTFVSVLANKEISFANELNKYIIWMAVVYLISWINSGIYMGSYDPKSLSLFKDLIFAYLFFFVTYKACHDVEQLKKVFYATILPLPYMFKVYYSNLSWMGFSHYSDKLRLNGGTFINLGSNEINAFYATYTFVVLAIAVAEKDLRLKIILLGGAALNIYCVIYGFSRGAYLAVLVGLVIWAIAASRIRVVVLSLCFALFLGAFGVRVLPKATVERFEMAFSDEEVRDESAQSRFEFWALAFDYYLDNPVIGIGFRNFPKVNPAGLDTHNYYIKVMVENGTLGVIILFLFLRACWKKIKELREIAADPFLKAFAIGMTPCMVAILIGNLFGDRFTHYPLISYFFVYMAIVLKGIKISKRESVYGT